MLETGLRISELCGLTDTDINFENSIVNVDHQLLRSAKQAIIVERQETRKAVFVKFQ